MKWKRMWGREYGIHYSELCALFLGELVKDISPINTSRIAMVPENGRVGFYIATEDQNKLMGIITKRYYSDFESFKELEKRTHKFGGEFLRTTEKIKSMKLGKLSNEELISLFEKYWIAMLRYNNTLYMTFVLTEFATDRASELLLKKVDKSKLDQYIQIVFTPSRKASVMKMKEEVLQSKNPEELYERYRWIPCVDIIFEPWTKEQFLNAIKDLKKEKEPELDLNDVLKELDLTMHEKNVLRMGNLAAYIKDRRDEYRRKGFCNMFHLLEEISARIKISVNDIGYMLKDEIIAALLGEKPDENKIKQRRKGFLVYVRNNKAVCASGKDIAPALKKLGIEIQKADISSEIKGIIGNKGRAKGIARIVKGAKDISKVKQGEILIAVSTHPDYITAMQKAAAFVADEGGLTCHAAIVAREMDKPCIVGAGNATKALKNGDRVEVDADAGIVRKL